MPKAMANDTRIGILQYLMNGEQCACTIVPSIGKAQPTASQHLRILAEAGIMEVRRDGTWMRYKIRDDRVVQIMGIQKIQ